MTAAVFDVAAATYDTDFTDTRLGRWLRKRVWRHLATTFAPGQRVLELGCGTGEDALWLARRGVSVVATDISRAMLSVAERKLRGSAVGLLQQDLTHLALRGQFDGCYANFGVLNCVPGVRDLGDALAGVLRRGGHLVAVLMGPFCAWETAWYLVHGDPSRAMRRWRPAVPARIGDQRLTVWYPSLATLRRALAPTFAAVRWEALGTLLPPSYLSPLVERWPATFARLARLDPGMPLGCAWSDHYLAVFARR